MHRIGVLPEHRGDVSGRPIGLAAFGHEHAPAWPGLDQAFVREYLYSPARCGAGDAIGLGEPVEARYLLAGQEFAVGDLLAQIGRDSQVGRD